MGLIDSGSKSNRLLASRRFTSTDIKTAQEAFTSVLDIQASEVYTQGDKIPSSGLPFSGSSQQRSNYSDGDNILLYYYRQRLTKSNVDSDVFFFMDPTGSNSGVTPQLIQDDQQTNFISPKYSVSSLANSTTEDAPPGYGVKVFKSTSENSGSLGDSDVVSANDYQFDYKTGVLQFDANKPGSSDIVYMTAYQYVGTTLETGVNISGDISGSSTSTGSFGRVEAVGDIAVSGSIRHYDDSDTRIKFTDDDINIAAGGKNFVDFTEDTVSEATFNEEGADIDFRVESENDNKAIFVDASQDSIQLGSAATTHVTASGNVSSSFTSTGSFGRLQIAGNSNLVGNLVLGGNITIGDSDSDSINITADLSSSLIPNADVTYDLGTNSKRYQFGYIESVSSTNITASGDLSVEATASLGKVVAGDLTEEIYLSVISTDSGNRYAFEGEIAPNFSVEEGKSYRFDQSDNSNNGHPFKFSQTENGTHGSGTEYTTGVFSSSIDQGTAGSFIELRVDKNTPNHLYYYCVNHSGMGSNALILKNDMTNLHLVSGSSLSTGSFGKLIGDGSEITNITEEDPNAIAFALALGG